MGRVVSNATPIIYLTKIGRLSLLKETYEDALISPAIERELTAGDYPEVPAIRDAIQEGWLEVKDLDLEASSLMKKLSEAKGLHEGEKEIIALAYTKHLPLLIDEDGRTGRHIARIWGVEVKGTLRAIVESYERGVLSYEEAKEIFHQLLTQGFRVSAEIYNRALSLLEAARRRET